MKAKALTVHWHLENQPIYSAHFQPSSSGINNRLATAGGDNNVRIWRLEYQDAANPTTVTSLTYLATLAKHTQAVNVVRFDPKGAVLASAGDDGTIFLWVQSDAAPPPKAFGASSDTEEDKETWKLRHVCRSSISEIYDLAWSPDSQFIIAGSMDNIARVYSAQTGQCIRELAEHSHYVQGVAWDPFNEYIATQSSDRSVHIYNLKTKDGQFALGHHYKIAKADLPTRKLPLPKPSIPSPSSSSNTSGSNSDSQSRVPSLTSTSPSPHAPSMGPLATPTPSSISEPYPRISASPDYSTPGTPSSTCSAMNPPPPTIKPSHSRKSSFSAGNTASCPESPRSMPSSLAFIPLPAVRQLGSPSIGYRSSYLYHNETFTSFFRRLTFSPDGSLLLTPSGVFKYHQSLEDGKSNNNDETTNTVYIYTRSGLNRPPVAHLPGLRKPSLAICCSPVYYTLRGQKKRTSYVTLDSSTSDEAVGGAPLFEDLDDSSKKEEVSAPVFALKYRMVYAVATQDSIVVYDTEQKQPLCIVSNLHYSTFTDLTWSPDGNNLLMTSTDGFCSVIIFDKGELGEVYTEPISHPPVTVSQSPRKRTDSTSSATSSAGELFIPTIPPPRPSSSNSVSSPVLEPSSALAVNEPLVPLISSMPPIVSHGSPHNPQYTPPHTPLSSNAQLATASTPGSASRQATLSFTPIPKKPEKRSPDAPIASSAASTQPSKKRRIAPTLISTSTDKPKES